MCSEIEIPTNSLGVSRIVDVCKDKEINPNSRYRFYLRNRQETVSSYCLLPLYRMPRKHMHMSDYMYFNTNRTIGEF